MKQVATIVSCFGLMTLASCVGTPEPVADATTGCTRVKIYGTHRAVSLRTEAIAQLSRMREPNSPIGQVVLKLPQALAARDNAPDIHLTKVANGSDRMICRVGYHISGLQWCERQLPESQLGIIVSFKTYDPSVAESEAAQLYDYVRHDVICPAP